MLYSYLDEKSPQQRPVYIPGHLKWNSSTKNVLDNPVIEAIWTVRGEYRNEF